MRWRGTWWLALLCLGWALVACGQAGEPAASATTEQNLLVSAGAEATAIIQQAQATAVVLQARAQATVLVGQAGMADVTPPPPTLAVAVAASPVLTEPAPATPGKEPAGGATPPASTPAEDLSAVEVVSVGFAADGGMIMVQVRAPKREAAKWWPGTVSVLDEGKGTVYAEVPVMPKIGPLIGRPAREGQLGYVMLVNQPPRLQPGALVTVVLGMHRFEHVPVE